jgi:hypothetical protein
VRRIVLHADLNSQRDRASGARQYHPCVVSASATSRAARRAFHLPLRKGLNFFAPDEQALLHAIQDPKGNIAGFRRGDLMTDLARFSLTRLLRQLRRLLDLGVVKRVAGTYRYYLTKAGRAATAAATRLTEATIVPSLI